MERNAFHPVPEHSSNKGRIHLRRPTGHSHFRLLRGGRPHMTCRVARNKPGTLDWSAVLVFQVSGSVKAHGTWAIQLYRFTVVIFFDAPDGWFCGTFWSILARFGM